MACGAVLLTAVVAVTVPRYGVPRISRGFNPSALTITVGQELDQTLRVNARGLRAITLNIVRANAAEVITVELLQRRRDETILVASKVIRLSNADTVLTLDFTPIEDSHGSEFILRLRPEARENARVTVLTTEGHEYQAGQLTLDGRPLPLDLVMDVDARNAQPWRAFAAAVHSHTGLVGLEWLVALGYFGAACAVIVLIARDERSV